jgi:adenine deaminase
MFIIPAKSTIPSSSLLQMIGVVPRQIITQKRIIQARIDDDYYAVVDAQIDLAKLAVIELHHRTGNIGLGFVQGFDLEKGAIASSVAHDSHNLAVAYDKQVTASLPLPIAGLMSD